MMADSIAKAISDVDANTIKRLFINRFRLLIFLYTTFKVFTVSKHLGSHLISCLVRHTISLQMLPDSLEYFRVVLCFLSS